LLIRNKEYVSAAFYFPLLSSSSSAETTWSSLLYRMKLSSDPSRLFEMPQFMKLFSTNHGDLGEIHSHMSFILYL
jgi:hypothetical protein